MSTSGPPAGGDQDKSVELLALSWTWASLSLIMISLRFYSRIKITQRLWWDDFFALVTMCLVLGFTITWTIYAHYGGCRHAYYLSPSQLEIATKINWISHPFYVIGAVTGKVSIACLILRIQALSKWRTYFLYALMGILFVIVVPDVTFTYAQCKPVWALWDTNVQGNCWPSYILTDWAIMVSCLGAFMDLALAVLPSTFIWKLQVSTSKKLKLTGLLSCGALACICSIMKIPAALSLSQRGDFTWDTIGLFIWNANEINILIIASCVPSLKPLYCALLSHTHSSIDRTGPQYQLPSYAHRAKTSGNSETLILPTDLRSIFGTDGWTDGASRSGTLHAETVEREEIKDVVQGLDSKGISA